MERSGLNSFFGTLSLLLFSYLAADVAYNSLAMGNAVGVNQWVRCFAMLVIGLYFCRRAGRAA